MSDAPSAWRSLWSRRRSALAFLAVIGVVEAWAWSATDPDFWLPDPFRAIVLGVAALGAIVQLLAFGPVRVTLQVVALATPLLLIGVEYRAKNRDASIASRYFARSPDRLLRYTYRPGAETPDTERDGTAFPINRDGLWDVEHALVAAPNTWRVVVLGDSVPNDPSIPRPARFEHQLETLLQQAAPAGRSVEVFNVSCEGYNTLQEVRLFERVALRYRPDLVVVAYVLNDPFLQDGSYRRMGNSFFAFRFASAFQGGGGNSCGLFARLYNGYGFDLVVRQSFERLRLLRELHGFDVMVATLPIVAPFGDPACGALYDQVLGVAREQGFATLRVVDAFAGLDHHAFAKPHDPGDITHPNRAGHDRIARSLAQAIAPRLQSARAAPGGAANGSAQASP